MRYAQIIQEQVFNTAAWVYHRTHAVKTIEAIQKDGFRAGEGDTYGRGIYATYDIASQFSQYMRRYGRYLVRAKVNLYGFLIFDMDVAAKVYGSADRSLWRQAKLLRLPIKRHKEETFMNLSDDVAYGKWSFTSIPAQMVYEERLVTGMTGIVYVGANDGRCIVAYDQFAVVPHSYAEAPVELDDEDNVIVPDPAMLQWRKIASRELLRPRTDAEKVSADPRSIRSIPKATADAQLAALNAEMPVSYLGRITPEVADHLIASGRFGEMASRSTPAQAKKAIFDNPINTFYLQNTHPVFRDIEVQRFLMDQQTSMHGLELSDDDLIGGDYAPKLTMAPYAPDDVLLKIIETQPDLSRFMGLFTRSAPHVRDPKTMAAMLKATPLLVTKVKNPPPDLLRAIVQQQPSVVTHIKNPPIDLVKLAVAEVPSVLRNLDRRIITADVMRAAASKHIGALAAFLHRRDIPVPDDVRRMVDDYNQRRTSRQP